MINNLGMKYWSWLTAFSVSASSGVSWSGWPCSNELKNLASAGFFLLSAPYPRP